MAVVRLYYTPNCMDLQGRRYETNTSANREEMCKNFSEDMLTLIKCFLEQSGKECDYNIVKRDEAWLTGTDAHNFPIDYTLATNSVSPPCENALNSSMSYGGYVKFNFNDDVEVQFMTSYYNSGYYITYLNILIKAYDGSNSVVYKTGYSAYDYTKNQVEITIDMILNWHVRPSGQEIDDFFLFREGTNNVHFHLLSSESTDLMPPFDIRTYIALCVGYYYGQQYIYYLTKKQSNYSFSLLHNQIFTNSEATNDIDTINDSSIPLFRPWIQLYTTTASPYIRFPAGTFNGVYILGEARTKDKISYKQFDFVKLKVNGELKLFYVLCNTQYFYNNLWFVEV